MSRESTTSTASMPDQSSLSGEHALALMQLLATWRNTTTVVLHGQCVFEYKGKFPLGSVGSGYYNLGESGIGFEGHIRLEAIDHIHFQDKAHRGKQSYAFCFQDSDSKPIFKVFIGRDENGELHPEQVRIFQQIQHSGIIPAAEQERQS